MQVHIIVVGKAKEPHLKAAIDDYVGRISRYGKVVERVLKDGPEKDVLDRFERAIPERSRVVALEVEGKSMSSNGLADYVGKAELDSIQSLVFLIGGSYGLPSIISERAHLQLSLSRLTLPHRLARLLLCEQIYRAFTILRGEPYNH